MSATLLELPTETAETPVSCANCPAVQRLERALEKLTSEFRCEVGYWKSRHADAVKRIEQLKVELDQSRGETRSPSRQSFWSQVGEVCPWRPFQRFSSIPKKSRLPRRSEVRSPATRDTVGAIIPICRSRRNSSPCRRNRWPVRIAESRP